MSDMNADIDVVQTISQSNLIEYASLFAGFSWLITPRCFFEHPIVSLLSGTASAYICKFFTKKIYNILPNQFKPVFIVALFGSGLFAMCTSIFQRKNRKDPNPPSYSTNTTR